MARANGMCLKRWIHWDDAKKFPGTARPGVYLLAHFDTVPRSVDTTDKRIIYIGETCGQTLRKRWARFERSAFEGKRGHSGGRTYFKEFGARGRSQLFVAFSTPPDEANLLPLRTRHLERKWLVDFALAHQRWPRCNRK